MTMRKTASIAARNDSEARRGDPWQPGDASLPQRTIERADVRYEWRQGRLPGDRYVRVVRCAKASDGSMIQP